jgi:dihydroorotate dehydrogenase
MDAYARLLRPALFCLQPQAAHRVTRPALRSASVCRRLAGEVEDEPRLRVGVGELHLPGPLGLAPGFDKYGELTAGLSRLGFDYLVPGTIMADAEPDLRGRGIVRLPKERALVNCLALPSKGVEHSARELERNGSAVPLVISVGARDLNGFRRAHARLEPFAAAIELNLQCHNEGVGPFDRLDAAEELLAAILEQRHKPLFLRINAARTSEERDARLQLADRAFELGVDGFSAVGTREVREDARLVRGRGTLTGEPLRDWTLEAIRDLRDVTGGQAIIRARGGISTGEDAYRALAAGATCVEVFTAFVYRGWGVARAIKRELLQAMDRESVPSLESLRGPVVPLVRA